VEKLPYCSVVAFRVLDTTRKVLVEVKAVADEKFDGVWLKHEALGAECQYIKGLVLHCYFITIIVSQDASFQHETGYAEREA
jgi:hypothetical protein